jgi:hypothetical protein
MERALSALSARESVDRSRRSNDGIASLLAAIFVLLG